MQNKAEALNQEIIFNYLLRLYFGTTSQKELVDAAIDRAYRDFSRTLREKGKNKTRDVYDKWRGVMRGIASEIENSVFTSQDGFDKWHKAKCEELITIIPNGLCCGQSQKWLNMLLKYLVVVKFNSDSLILKNYQFFHVPIDNIIQNQLEQLGIPRIKGSWSRIVDYSIYVDYQKEIRKRFNQDIPLVIEFKLYNNSFKYNN